MDNYKIYARTVHGSTLKTTIESLKETFDQIPIRFSKTEGITIYAVGEDERGIGAVMKLDKAMFDVFHIDSGAGDEVVIAMEILKLNRALKSCSNNEVVSFSITHDNEYCIYITRYDKNHNKSKTFGIPTLEDDDQDEREARNLVTKKLRENTAQESYEIPCSVFVQSCKDATLIQSEYIELCIQGNSFVTTAKDTKQQMYYEERIEMKNKDNIPESGINIASHKYSLQYLNAFNKCANLSDSILIKIGSKGELIMEYLIDMNQHNQSHSYIIFILMPIKDITNIQLESRVCVEDTDDEQ